MFFVNDNVEAVDFSKCVVEAMTNGENYTLNVEEEPSAEHREALVAKRNLKSSFLPDLLRQFEETKAKALFIFKKSTQQFRKKLSHFSKFLDLQYLIAVYIVLNI
jgi:hypothetical protein